MTKIQRKIDPRKSKSVADVKNICAKRSVVVVTNYHGVKDSELFRLRSELKSHGANFKVVKSKLAKIAISNEEFEGSHSIFKGPVAIAYSDDFVSTSKALYNFAKKNENFKIIGCIFEKNTYNDSKVKEYSSMPTLDESRAKIIGLLTANASKLISILELRKEKLEESSIGSDI